MQPPIVSYHKKIRLIALALFASMGVIVSRLYNLQISQAQSLYALGQKNFIKVEKITCARGNILDTNGELLATNRPMTNLYWQGSQNHRLSTEQQEIIALLQTVIGEQITQDRLTEITLAERYGKLIPLASDITFEQLSAISEKLASSPNIKLTSHFKRFYPHHTLASHLVGYLGQINCEETGKMGLEKLLDKQLHGQDGEVEKIINSLGRSLSQKELRHALAGENIQTTIDLKLQQLVEAAFDEQWQGTMLLMDPKTGALRALISRPNFDPNIFLNTIDVTEWQELQQKNAFLNRAFNASYPPASIFKLVTISAALEEGIIDPDSSVYCRGFFEFGNYRPWCMNHNGHGQLTIKEAVAKSCNILFFQIGKQMHIDTLAQYAHRFGLGEKTNMLFSDLEGLVPTSHWKLKTKGERWWPGETLSAAIGQSFLLTTPIQIARMIASIFEGYLVTPRLLEEEKIEKKPLDISKRTRDFLKDSMRRVVKIGTGSTMSHIKNIEIYAKTGTAQVSSLELRNKDNKFSEHGWLVAYFRYKDFEPLTMVVIAEHSDRSTVATIIAKNFLVAYQTYCQEQQSVL